MNIILLALNHTAINIQSLASYVPAIIRNQENDSPPDVLNRLLSPHGRGQEHIRILTVGDTHKPFPGVLLFELRHIFNYSL